MTEQPDKRPSPRRSVRRQVGRHLRYALPPEFRLTVRLRRHGRRVDDRVDVRHVGGPTVGRQHRRRDGHLLGCRERAGLGIRPELPAAVERSVAAGHRCPPARSRVRNSAARVRHPTAVDGSVGAGLPAGIGVPGMYGGAYGDRARRSVGIRSPANRTPTSRRATAGLLQICSGSSRCPVSVACTSAASGSDSPSCSLLARPDHHHFRNRVRIFPRHLDLGVRRRNPHVVRRRPRPSGRPLKT